MSAPAHAHGHGDSHGHDHGHAQGWHPGPMFYTGIAVFLGILTFVELGPLFDWYNLPLAALLVLSVVKFVVVVAFFMHLATDASIFTQVFGAPLIGGGAMVWVLMLLHHSVAPSPHTDFFPTQERLWENYARNCSSWLTSHVSNVTYCASPPIAHDRLVMYVKASEKGKPVASSAPDLTKMSAAEQQAALVDNGKSVYETNCQTCHQANGQGVAGVFPPLAGSDYLTDKNVHVTTVIKGLNGEITVNGVKYNSVMAPFGALSDFDIASVVTYERNSWGNSHGVVLPEEVKALR